MKCENCEDETTFIIENVQKNDIMCFCDIHFWKFCTKMGESYKQFQNAIEDINEALLNDAKKR